MNKKRSISMVVSAFLISSSVLTAEPIDLSVLVPGANPDHAPAQISFYIYDSLDSNQLIAVQTFYQHEWRSSATEGGVSYKVSFAALDTDSNQRLWYEAYTDAGLVGSGWLPARTAASNMYVEGEIRTDTGVRFPSGLQIAPGITSETDPTVDASVKDGVSWGELSGVPAGFLDGIDNEGVTAEVDPTVAASVKDGVSWSELSAIPAGFSDNVDNEGVTIEVDPQVGSNTVNHVPKWIGSALATGSLYDDGEDIGIGTTSPTHRLHAVDETPTNDDAAVYGEHAVTDFYGIGVQGVGGYRGVAGAVSATGSNFYYGVYGSASTSSGSGTTYGVYGTASGGTNNWAGYFSGDGYVSDNLGVGTISPDTQLALGGTGSSNGITLGDDETDPATIYHGSSSLTFNVPGTSTNFRFSNSSGNNRLTFGTVEYFEDCGSNCVYTNGSLSTTVLHVRGGADIAEPFDVTATESQTVEPGMLLSIDPENPGRLRISSRAYDSTVAGIVSGANGINAGLTLAQEGVDEADGEIAVALTGRAYAKADASYGAIKPGDLLTTSATPGHAIKVTDRDRGSGAVVGKAMSALDQGQDLVLVLISLQ